MGTFPHHPPVDLRPCVLLWHSKKGQINSGVIWVLQWNCWHFFSKKIMIVIDHRPMPSITFLYHYYESALKVNCVFIWIYPLSFVRSNVPKGILFSFGLSLFQFHICTLCHFLLLPIIFPIPRIYAWWHWHLHLNAQHRVILTKYSSQGYRGLQLPNLPNLESRFSANLKITEQKGLVYPFPNIL